MSKFITHVYNCQVDFFPGFQEIQRLRNFGKLLPVNGIEVEDEKPENSDLDLMNYHNPLIQILRSDFPFLKIQIHSFLSKTNGKKINKFSNSL